MTGAAPIPRFFVDLQVTQSTQYAERGMPRYAAEFGKALLESGAPIAAFALNPTLPAPSRLPDALRDSGLIVWNTIDTYRNLSKSGSLLSVLTCPFFEQHPIEAVLPRHMLVNGGPIAVVLYDLIPYVMADSYQTSFAERSLYRVRRQLVQRADVVLALSDHTRRDAIEVLGIAPERITSIGAGASEFFHLPNAGEDPTATIRRTIPEIDRSFVLGVGGADPRKNWLALIDAFALLPRGTRERLQLVAVSNLSSQAALRAHAHLRGLRDNQLVLAALVSDEVLRALYQTASLFVLPSLYEGFGLPVLEAVRCGCPAITSDVSSLPEVLDFAPATFRAEDPASIAATMNRALVDKTFRTRLKNAGSRAAGQHTWTAVAKRAQAGLSAVRVSQHARPIRRRFALLGRSSSERSIVTGFRTGVVDLLAERCEVDCFNFHTETRRPNRSNRRWRSFPIESFGRTFVSATYDTVIFTIGESDNDESVTNRLRSLPGIAFLRAEPSQAVEIIKSARALILPSEAAQRQLGSLGQSVVPPSEVLPLPPPPFPEDYEEPKLQTPVIVVPGALGAGNQPKRIIEALALLRPDVRARLVFLGRSEARLARDLAHSARQLGVADDVVFTGFVASHMYRAQLAAARCAVKLQTGWSADGSLSLLDCLAAGVPVITDRADAAELQTAGAVCIQPEGSAHELATVLRGLLLDPEQAQSRRTAARAYAASWTSAKFVKGLLAAIDHLGSESIRTLPMA
jgi:glycosyltransferase involved in cell wall biosynthesis